MRKVNVLVLGCGNISFGYDRDTDFVRTHCKALSLLDHVSVSVYDADAELAKNAAEKYGFSVLPEVLPATIGMYDWVVIASPTPAHFEYLSICFAQKVPVVICEKPVAENIDQLNRLETLYKAGNTKVLVNYMRRFQKAYKALKETLQEAGDTPAHINVTYQRGLNNNFSHAGDLLNYLTGDFSLSNINIISKVFDEFESDPTVSFSALLNGSIPLFATGISHARYSYFEMELYFSTCKIHLAENGGRIIRYEAGAAGKYYSPLIRQDGLSSEAVLDNLMKAVYDEVQEIYNNGAADNFLSATKLNKTILKIAEWQS